MLSSSAGFARRAPSSGCGLAGGRSHEAYTVWTGGGNWGRGGRRGVGWQRWNTAERKEKKIMEVKLSSKCLVQVFFLLVRKGNTVHYKEFIHST